ncbi:MAG: DMT family transporter [Chitinophagaceae bacterium]
MKYKQDEKLKEINTTPKATNKQKQNAYFALTATSLIWGTTWVVAKIAVQKTPALEVSYLRQFFAGFLVLIFFLIKGEKLPTWLQFRWLLVVSFFMFIINNGFSTWSVKYIPSGLAALIGSLYPLFVVLIEMIFFRNKNYTLLTFIGLFLGIIGIIIVFYENAFHKHSDGYNFGIIICFIAMLSWSIGTIFIARNKYKMNSYYAMGWQMFIASFFIYLMADGTHNTTPFQNIPAQTWGAIAYLVVFGSLLAFAAFIYTIKYLPPAIASLYAYINPIVAIVVGSVVFADETLSLNVLFGSLVTLSGVYLVNISLKKK